MGQPNLRIPLDIQRFAMGLGANAWENQNSGANTSSISWSLSATTSGGTYDNTGKCYYRVYTDNYDTGNVSFKIGKTTTLNFGGTTPDYGHNADGSLGSKVVHFILYDNANNKTYTQDITVNFTKYNRQPAFTENPSVTGATETTMTFKWGGVNLASDIYYSLDNANWVHVTSDYTTITGLNPNGSYTIFVQARNQADNSQTATATTSGTTYDYPQVVGDLTNVTIGQPITLNLYNPLNRNITLQLINGLSTILADYTGNGSGNIIGFNNAQQQANMYASIPNNTSASYWTRVICNETGSIRDKGYGTYSINTSQCYPTFNLFEYEDVNDKTLALTGNKKNCIVGYSNIKAIVSTANKASAKNSASMSSYRLVIGSKNNQVSYSSSNDVSMQIDNAENGIYSVYAIDSRGLSTEVKLLAETQIDYTKVAKNSSSASRENGVSEVVNLSLKGSIWKGNFGKVENSIESVSYKYKTGDNEYVDGVTPISLTIDDDGKFSFEGQIRGDTDEGFNIENVYTILVIVKDKLSTAEYTITLGSGRPHMAWHKNGVSFMGKYDEELGGALQVNGVRRDGVYSTEEQKIGYWINGKPIYRKTLIYTISSTLNQYVNVPHNVENMDDIISHISYVILNGNSYAQPCFDIYLKTVCNRTNFRYYNVTDAVIGSNGITIIEYTKTTDKGNEE